MAFQQQYLCPTTCSLKVLLDQIYFTVAAFKLSWFTIRCRESRFLAPRMSEEPSGMCLPQVTRVVSHRAEAKRQMMLRTRFLLCVQRRRSITLPSRKLYQS